MNLTKEDYLKLLEEVSKSDNYEDDEMSIPEEWAWMPAEPAVKERMLKSKSPGWADITKMKRAEIGTALLKYGGVTVGDFSVMIEKRTYGNNPTTHLDIEIWEKRYRTPTGRPCNMDFRVNIHKDSRFTTCSWLSQFNTQGEASNILIADAVDVIRWLQVAKRISAFM